MAGYPSIAAQTGIGACRADFPALSEKVNGKPLSYLDTAASAQKPHQVIERMREAMSYTYANIHRGLYHFSQVTTQEYEAARGKVAEFINAFSAREVVFTRNATEGINLVAQSWGRMNLKAGDEIILSEMEHHANIVPWQLLAGQTGAVVRIIRINNNGTLDQEHFKTLLSERTRLVSIVHISNSLGTINPVAEMIGCAKAYNPDIKVLIDASQSVVHGIVDVQALGCDFVVFTGHKLYGPTGVGVLWGREDLLNAMPPYQGGGDMIEAVSFGGTTFKPAPARFEAGTPAIVEVIGLGAAIDYLRVVGHDAVADHEKNLFAIMMRELSRIDGLVMHGTAPDRAGIVSFTLAWGQISDIAMILDKQGVAVRAGHHCCMPLMDRLGVSGTLRASLGLYSSEDDINALVQALKKAKDMLA